MQVKYHHIIGQGEGAVIGCDVCGEVELLSEGATHKCNRFPTPMAVTLDVSELPSPEPA